MRFEERAREALETLNVEVQQANDWLRSDRPPYWKEQVRLAAEGVHQAKVELQRCLLYPVADERPSCREERDALNKANAHWDYCREKAELVTKWRRELNHELFEFEGRLSALRELLDAELPQGQGRLNQFVQQLDKYTVEAPPEAQDPKQLQTEQGNQQNDRA